MELESRCHRSAKRCLCAFSHRGERQSGKSEVFGGEKTVCRMQLRRKGFLNHGFTGSQKDAQVA